MSFAFIKFVSRKINKIRWKQRSNTIFVTGSYDDEDNNICVWKFCKPSFEEGENVDDYDPKVTSTAEVSGCVTDLKMVSEDLFLASSSLGSVTLFRFSEEKLENLHTWEMLHSFAIRPASTTGISVKGDDIASVGNDGKLCLFNFNSTQKIREIESSDVCSFSCVTYLRYQEIVAGNTLGYLRLWDIRSSETSSCLLNVTRDQRGVSSLTVHPTQSHVLATGYEDGSLCIWDMRQDRKPVSLLNGHSAAVTELLFHPTNPDFLYTSSLDGSLWQWNSSNIRSSASVFSTSLDSKETASKGNTWFISDANKHKLEVTSLHNKPWASVNSLDLNGSTLIWGTDNEELCILNDVSL